LFVCKNRESVGDAQQIWEHEVVPEDIERYFSPDMAGAQSRFRDACTAAGAASITVPHPLAGPDGGALETQVAILGPVSAQRLLVLLSGVHGPELLCGSACQTGLLQSGLLADLPGETGVLLVHAINPWGSAHGRRVNEDNVDLCRNFLDFDASLPTNVGYEDIHAAFAPMGPADNSRECMRALMNYEREHGLPALMSALMGGQYEHADGFSYGGREPTWSNRVLTQQLQEHGNNSSHVVALDFHSGLGPYGYGTAVAMHTGDTLARVRRYFGGWVEAPREAAAASPGDFHSVEGHCADGFVRALPNAEVELITVEYGTHPVERNLQALVDDHWWQVAGLAEDPERIAAEMRITHYPDDPEWRYAVWTRAVQVLRQALACLDE
jgi:hypothetical protein